MQLVYTQHWLLEYSSSLGNAGVSLDIPSSTLHPYQIAPLAQISEGHLVTCRGYLLHFIQHTLPYYFDSSTSMVWGKLSLPHWMQPGGSRAKSFFNQRGNMWPKPDPLVWIDTSAGVSAGRPYRMRFLALLDFMGYSGLCAFQASFFHLPSDSAALWNPSNDVCCCWS